MRQAAIQLKSRIGNVQIMNNNIEVERMILRSMLSLMGGLALLYVFILGTMVFNIVQRKALEKQALTLASEVSSLELSYLSVSGNIDVALSSSMGFKEIQPTFVTRTSLGSLDVKQAQNEI